MAAKYRDKQNRSHFKSFANKIFTGIREIKPEYAAKRAIWELFQNALDTVDDSGVITIEKTKNGLLFKHNGKPFKDDEFGGLIKQFSVGKAFGDNKEKLGQYGTGFISTHIYGKKIIINGSIQTGDGTYRTLTDFALDREALDIEELTDKLLEQEKAIETLCDNTNFSEVSPTPFTTFEYQATARNQIQINEMLEYIRGILPYIFCFNDKLEEVKLVTESAHLIYNRNSESDAILNLTCNGQIISLPFISDFDNGIKIILGTPERVINDIPKQFLYYPLMETAQAGYNFIIHANNFKPNKERDFLHKDSGNDELKSDVATNQRLLKIAFDSVIERIVDDRSISLIEMCKIEFNSTDSDFEKDLKIHFINSLRNLERFEFQELKFSLSTISYFDDKILLLDDSAKRAVYSSLKQFYLLPPYDIYCELSRHINNWNIYGNLEFKTLQLHDVGEIIMTSSKGNYYYINDKESYKKLIALMSGDIHINSRLSLIPNIHGDFKKSNELVKWDIDELLLIKVVDNINASISEKYIHKDFATLENISPYNREKFKDDFSKFCNELADSVLKNKDLEVLGYLRFNMLVQHLNNFIALNKKTQLNIEVAEFYSTRFLLNINQDEIQSPTVDINYQPAIKLLANLYIKIITDDQVLEDLENLKKIIGIMFKNTNLKDELLHKLECLPDQNGILKCQTDLKRDDVKDEQFKDEYQNITGKDIRSELAYDGFEKYLQHSGFVNGSYLGEAIETSLNKEKIFIPVNNDTLDQVLRLIERISAKPSTWGQWLRTINGVKEEILMHKFKDEKTRTSLFNILTKSPETIELLGDLAKLEDLEDLIKKGKEKQKEENRTNNHLQYINKIGIQIQDLIEKQLGKELAETVKVESSNENSKIIAKEEQNGQDFIIYKNSQPLHYIEVKSKWDENGRFALSKNQTERCAKEKDHYSVITVNVERYKREKSHNTEDVSYEDLKDYVRVNDGLGNFFEKLVAQNISIDESKNPKLIEYRGSIPQKTIDDDGYTFEEFTENLVNKISRLSILQSVNLI